LRAVRREEEARLLSFARTMRGEPTNAERLLWWRLRRERLGVHFRRQHRLHGFIVDFYCDEAKLAIELDGGGHNEDETRAYDEWRSRMLEEHGITVLRFWNPEVERSTDAVMERIWYQIQMRTPLPALPPPGGGIISIRNRGGG
jgi:very-short-patch-repair endonuclease